MIKEVDKVQKEELLKLMYKYGFHSLNKEPFLYDGEQGVGVAVTFKNPFYGMLSRIYIPKNNEEAEEFLAKYCWYKKNGQNYNIQIELNDYEIKDPEITFTQSGKKLSSKEMHDFEKYSFKESSPKKKNYIQKLKRSALILLQVIAQKIDIQNKTYQNLVNLTNQYEEKLYELNKKKQEYEKKDLKLKQTEKLSDEITDYQGQIQEMEQNVRQINSEEELKDYIESLIAFLKELETSDSLIQNKYELIRKPIEIESLEEQIKEVEQLKRKKGMFGKKENLDEILEKIKQQSTLKEIVTFATYRENELKRIEEKYALIPDMDIRTIGDFFAEFDNLNIQEPLLEEDPENPSYELTMKKLELSFTNYSKEEQKILILYHSLLKDIYDLILKGNPNNAIKEFIELIKNPNNILIKIKFFKNIDISSVERCRQSIIKELSNLQKIQAEKLLADINVFFKNGRDLDETLMIKSSNKRTLAPSSITTNNELIYIAKLKKDTQVYFVPTEITYDIEQEDTLILKQNQPLILIDLQKNKINDEKSDILKVVQYEEILQSERNYKYVTTLKIKKIEQYKKITIESR